MTEIHTYFSYRQMADWSLNRLIPAHNLESNIQQLEDGRAQEINIENAVTSPRIKENYNRKQDQRRAFIKKKANEFNGEAQANEASCALTSSTTKDYYVSDEKQASQFVKKRQARSNGGGSCERGLKAQTQKNPLKHSVFLAQTDE